MKKISTLFKGLMLLFVFSAFSQLTIAQCTYQLRLDDSFGDGWNGNTIDVKVGTTTTNYTLSNFSDTTINLTVSTGDSIVLDYLAGGSFNNEVSFTLFDANSNSIYTSGLGPATAVAYADTATCPSCLIPTSLFANNILATTVDLNWTENNSATQWQIQYGTAGFTLGSGIDSISNSNPKALTGLSSNTNYDFYVRSICSVGDTSAWSTVGSFVTAFVCPTGAVCATYTTGDIQTDRAFTALPGTSTCPGSLSLTIPAGNRIDSVSTSYDMTALAINNAWMSEQRSWLYSVNAATGEAALSNGAGTTNGTFSYNRTGITIANGVTGTANFELHAGRTFGGTGCNSDYNIVDSATWTVVAYYSLAPACLEPLSVSASSITADSAQLNWTATGSATEWIVEWDTAGFTAGSGSNSVIVNTDTFTTITGLTELSTYNFYVRSICGPLDTSSYSSLGVVNTPCNAFVAPFSEDFNSLSIPSCWSQGAGNSEDWEFQLTDGHIGNAGNQGSGSTVSGGGLASVDDSSPHNTNTTLESPLIDVSGLTTPRLTFFTISDNEANLNGNVDFHVDVYDGANWNDSIFFSDTNTIGGTWEKIFVDLSSLTITGPIQLRFVVDENNGTLFDDDRAIDDVVVEETPSCIAPTNLVASTIQDTSITFSWTDNNAATQWEIEWDTSANYTAGTSNISIVNTDTFAVINGLTPIENYTFRVRAICAIGDTSAWTVPLDVRTNCPAAFTAPFFLDFENDELDAPPICWLEYSTISNGFVEVEDFTGTAAPFNGSQALYIYSGSGFTQGSDTLIAVSPRLSDLSNSDKQIRFQANSDDPVTQLIIGTVASPLPSSTFNGIDTITFPTADTYQEVIVRFNSLNGYNGTDEYIVFAHNLGATFDYIRIDDFFYEDIPSCPKPTAPSFDNVTDSSVVVSWTNGGTETEWQIEYGTAGFTLGTGTIISTTTNPDTITGLQSATSYDFYVRAVCAAMDSSIFSTVLSGSTRITPAQGVSCTTGVSGNVFSDDLESLNGWTGDIGTGSSLELWNYDSGGTGSSNTGPSAAYSGTQYIYVETSGASVGDSVSIVSPAIDLTNASDFAELSFWMHAYGQQIGRINVGVGTSATGPFTNEFSYLGETQSDETDPFVNVGVNLDSYTGQTIYLEFLYITNGSFEGDIALDLIEVNSCLPCPTPTNLTSNNVTANSVDLSWTDNGGPTQWIVEYDSAGFMAGMGRNSTVVNTDTFTTISSLLPNTSYDYYVRAICNVGDTGAYSTSASFMTDLQYYPVGTLNTEDANGVADSLNLECITSGTVVGVDLDGNAGLSFYIIDQSGTSPEGINVFNFNDVSNYTVNEGDSIKLRGTIIQFNGLTEFNPDSIELISTGGSLPAPTVVSTLDESTEAQLIQLNGWSVVTGSGTGSYNMTATNGVDTLTIRVDADTDINDSLDIAPLAPGDTICSLIGIGSQFDNSNPFTDGYQIFPMRFSDIDTTSCQPMPLVYYPIGTINGEDSLGVADSLNVNCRISGTVTGVDRRGGGYEFALIDLASGIQEGITVFDFNDLSNYTNPTEGDSLEVYGTVDQFNGLTQFRPDSIIVLSLGNATVAAPNLVNDLDESTESRLVELNDNFVLLDPSGSFSYNMDATNGIDTITIRVDSDTDVDDSLSVMTNSLVAGDTICGLIGIGGQFDNSSPFTEGYQVFPSRYSDLTICRLPVGLNSEKADKATISISPNPTDGEFTIRTSGFNTSTVRIQIRDISGRVISDEMLTNANNRINKTMNLSENAKGLYFINIFDGEAVIHQKLILR